MEAIKKALLWTYGRTTWQWDLLCLLILAFIFLTPKQWFENTEFTARKQALRRGYSTVLLENNAGPANLLPREEIERRVRSLINRAEAKIVNIRERRDPQTNQVTGYEVDIQ
jgi:hypothetical protein